MTSSQGEKYGFESRRRGSFLLLLVLMGRKPVSYETRNSSRGIGGEGMSSIVTMYVLRDGRVL